MKNISFKKLLSGIFTCIMCVFLLGAVVVSMFTLNSFSVSSVSTGKLDLSSEYDVVYSNMLSEALGDILGYKKVYIIPETAASAPEPDQDRFGNTANGNEGLDAAIAQAEADGLVSASDLVWGNNKYGARKGEVEYYQDSTILAIAWKQRIENIMFNFCEVTIAHPSQFRRMLAGGEIGSSTLATASVLAGNANSVVALSGDYYNYRTKGVVVWERSIYRNNPTHLDTCFIDKSGNMHLMYNDESLPDAELRQYIEERDISFSLSFGPILVRDGVRFPGLRGYTTGQPEDDYARVALGQLGELHYLLVTVDGGVGGEDGTNVYLVAEVMDNMNCQQAYCLDGGQTATMVFNDHIFNRVGYGNERDISDIIYFGSALPN